MRFLLLTMVGLISVPAYAQRDTLANPPLLDSAMQEGWRDFSAYKTPGMCLRAAQALGVVTGRRLDESYDVPPSDTMAHVASKCGAKFTVETVNPGDLLDLMHLALIARDEARVHAAADRYVLAAREPIRRSWALYDVDTVYAHAVPRRWHDVEATTARLDSTGAAGALPRRLAHLVLLEHARQLFDIPAIEREALALLALYPQLPESDRTDREADGPMTGVMEIVQAELLRNPATVVTQTTALIKPLLSAQHLQMFQSGLQYLKIDWIVAQIGKPVPALNVPYWLTSDSAPHTFPVSGKVSIYAGCGDVQDLPARWDSAQVSRWRNLVHKYGTQVNVTFICQTAGYFSNSGPLQPKEEAERLRHYFFDQLKLPVTIALDTMVFQQLPDGRRIATPRTREMNDYYKMGFILADAQGKVVLLSSSPPGERALDALVTRTVASQGQH